jgi:hypothetical protein
MKLLASGIFKKGDTIICENAERQESMKETMDASQE